MHIPKHLCGIIGWPLGQTLSPLVHNWGFQSLELPYAYMAFPTPPERLDSLMAAVRTLPVHGLSVTIPHKRAVMDYLDVTTDRAKAVGAVNTLYWQGEAENAQLVGDNTDVTGFLAPLLGSRPQAAVVLGAGGAARAAVAGLRQLDVPKLGVAARDMAKAEALCAELGGQPLPLDHAPAFGATLVVNSTPLGMYGDLQDRSPWPAQSWAPGMTAYDLVYNPLTTRFLAEAAKAGAKTIDGLNMFVGQAACQFRAWTGQDLPGGARTLLLQALGEKGE